MSTPSKWYSIVHILIMFAVTTTKRTTTRTTITTPRTTTSKSTGIWNNKYVQQIFLVILLVDHFHFRQLPKQ